METMGVIIWIMMSILTTLFVRWLIKSLDEAEAEKEWEKIKKEIGWK